MKKLILGAVLSVFGISAAHACDGMKGHEKADKSDSSSQTNAKSDTTKGSKASSKADQKS